MKGEGKGRVCVTGGTGYVASWLIKSLLEHGYSVHTTIRSSPGRKKDVSYLTNLPRASERLKIFNADLDKPESFEEPIEGCIGVFHVAHPIDFQGNESQEVLNQRSVNAMVGILQVCLNSKTVQKVVYTSSDATIVFNDKDLEVVDEESWSDVDFITEFESFGAPYFISKILAEKAGLEFAEKHGIDFVTINPTYIHGPFISPDCPGSVRISLAMILGGEDLDTYSSLLRNFQLVHVDDVARAHIFLFEDPYVKGRYICSAHATTLEKLAKFLSARYPEFQIPSPEFMDDITGRIYGIPSSRKLLESGFKYKYGLEEMYDDAIECCKVRGILYCSSAEDWTSLM